MNTFFQMQRGVYFLGNDQVLDLTIAFLNSFRKYNPDIPLIFIPYNDNCGRILSMKDFYNFQVFAGVEILKACDEISLMFHAKVNGTYRKMAMWDGTFDEFVYIDVDTIVLQNIDFAFKYLDKYDCYTSHSNMPGIRKFVWKDSIYDTNELSPEQIEYAANTGFITSKKGVITMKWIQTKLSDAVKLKDQMELYCQEQPLLNYLIVNSGRRYSSLYMIYQSSQDEEIMFEYWAGIKGAQFKNGIFVNRERVFLIHWAGCWQPRDFDFRLFKILKSLRIFGKSAKPKLHFFMPYKSLWRFYRYLYEGKTETFSN